MVKVLDGGKEVELALVGQLNDPDFPQQLSDFAYKIGEAKNKISPPEPQGLFQTVKNTEGKEHEGERREYDIYGITGISKHGPVQNQLIDLLRKKKLSVFKDNRDVVVNNRTGDAIAVFEIKSKVDTTSLYTGVGQLLLLNVNEQECKKRILVLPENKIHKKEKHNLVNDLQSIGIDLMTFSQSINESDVIADFDGIEDFISWAKHHF